jgi:hypothetical protein
MIFMQSRKPDRSVPERIAEDNKNLEIEGYVALHVGDYTRAREIFHKQYQLLMETQSLVDRPIHKGAPLYHLGLALYSLREPDAAIRQILLAYVEDTLSEDFDFEDNADKLPAARILRDIFVCDLRVLRKVKEASAKAKQEGLWSTVRDPEEILKKVASSRKGDD